MKKLILNIDNEEDDFIDLLELVENCKSEGTRIELVSKKMDYKDLLMKSTGNYWLREIIGNADTFNDVDIPKSLEEEKEINIV